VPTTAPGVPLAQRLRELRRSGFPGTRLTQLQLATALSEDEPVADSTLSSWENVRSPSTPPVARLSAYAQFFATERSLEGDPHLVPADKLTPTEEKARKQLELELLALRDAPAESSQGQKFWRFDSGAPVTVICSDLRKSDELVLGPLTEEDNPNYAELYSYGDLDALFTLNGHLCRTNPETDVRLSREVTAQALSTNLVVVGGIAWNEATRRLNEMLPLPVRQVTDPKIPSGEIFVTDGARYEPLWLNDDPGKPEKPGVLVEDVGMLARMPNPYNKLRTLTYCNGIHSRGVLGAVRCLTDPAVRDDNEQYLHETFPDSDSFVILMRVPVLGGHTVSPSLRSAGVVRFQWAGN
jgi:hypothetical protein